MGNYSKASRNIVKYQGKNSSYVVRVTRDRRTIRETYSSFQDAIDARDEIEEVWRDTRQLKHSSLFQSANLRNAKDRYGQEKVELERYGNQMYYAVKCKCSKCSKTVKLHTAKQYRKFADRDRLCQSCSLSATVDKLVEIKTKNPKAYRSNRTTGIKNISYSRRHDVYVISISRSKSFFIERSKSLDDAIRIKERVLKFYDESGRLPNRDEI